MARVAGIGYDRRVHAKEWLDGMMVMVFTQICTCSKAVNAQPHGQGPGCETAYSKAVLSEEPR